MWPRSDTSQTSDRPSAQTRSSPRPPPCLRLLLATSLTASTIAGGLLAVPSPACSARLGHERRAAGAGRRCRRTWMPPRPAAAAPAGRTGRRGRSARRRCSPAAGRRGRRTGGSAAPRRSRPRPAPRGRKGTAARTGSRRRRPRSAAPHAAGIRRARSGSARDGSAPRSRTAALPRRCPATNACQTAMMRAGLSPTSAMSAKVTCSASAPSCWRSRSIFAALTTTRTGSPALTARRMNDSVPERNSGWPE